MAKGTLKIKGTADLIGKLRRNATLDDVKHVVRLNGSEMHRSAQRHAPVDTGNLKRAIKLDVEDDGFTAKVASTANYAPYQEYGTRYQSGKPHIRPAYYEQRQKFIKDMKRLMK